MKSGKVLKTRDADFDVIGIGSALLDLIVNIDDIEIAKMGLVKGGMQLIDEHRSNEIMSIVKNLPMSIAPGGSAANTVAGVSRFGGRSVFLGKVGMDKKGDTYIEETEKTGVRAIIARDESLTGHAITFITPDSERTFATHLGAALRFTAGDVNTDEIMRSRILHLEGYLFEPLNLREACYRALQCAKENGVLVSIDLSDPGLINRIRGVFEQVIDEYANIIFVNEDEAMAFTGKEGKAALSSLAGLCDLAVVKLGSMGSIIQQGDTVHTIPVYKTEVVNTNGAGDMYAAGMLFGISRGKAISVCGKYGSFASSLVVSQVGARYPDVINPASIA